MFIKSFSLTILGLCLAQTIYAADVLPTNEPEKSNARAYRAHLLSFVWPDKMSSEQVNYQNIYQLDNIKRFANEEDAIQSTSIMDSTTQGLDVTTEPNPFLQYQALMDRRVTILSNQTWPMIFEEQGSVVLEDFHSKQLFDGYPELTGKMKVKLGRYLETEIQYQHFIFDSFTAPVEQINQTKGIIFDELDPFEESDLFNEITPEEKVIQLYEPALVLSFTAERKTASKKLNYLDHPIIGSLLYFEPISVDDAEHELMLQALTEEEMVRDAEASISIEPEESLDILLNQSELNKPPESTQ